MIFSLGQFTAAVLSFATVEFIPLSSMACLFLGSNMIFGILFGRVILKEKIGKLYVVSMVICLVGITILVYGLVKTVLLVSGEPKEQDTIQQISNQTTTVIKVNSQLLGDQEDQPFVNETIKYNFTNMDKYIEDDAFKSNRRGVRKLNISLDKHNRKMQTSTLPRLIIGLVIPIIAGLTEAMTLISVKIVQKDIESVQIFTFWFALSGVILSVIGMLIFERSSMSFPMSNLPNILYLLGHVGCSSMAIICNVFSMRRVPAYMMGIFCNVQIPINMFLQYVFFRSWQPMDGGWIDGAGSVVVTVGVLIVPTIVILTTGQNNHVDSVENSRLIPTEQ